MVREEGLIDGGAEVDELLAGVPEFSADAMTIYAIANKLAWGVARAKRAMRPLVGDGRVKTVRGRVTKPPFWQSTFYFKSLSTGWQPARTMPVGRRIEALTPSGLIRSGRRQTGYPPAKGWRGHAVIQIMVSRGGDKGLKTGTTRAVAWREELMPLEIEVPSPHIMVEEDLAGAHGFEPRFSGLEADVLPLNYAPVSEGK